LNKNFICFIRSKLLYSKNIDFSATSFQAFFYQNTLSIFLNYPISKNPIISADAKKQNEEE
jgi:hypothetical protein